MEQEVASRVAMRVVRKFFLSKGIMVNSFQVGSYVFAGVLLVCPRSCHRASYDLPYQGVFIIASQLRTCLSDVMNRLASPR